MLVRKNRRAQKGDTLIEVLFAVTVFSLIVVMALSLMNQGTAASLRSLQITLVRQTIDSQAETLRFLNSSYVAAYQTGYAPNTADATTSPAEEYYKIIQAIKSDGATSVSKYGGDGLTCQVAPAGSFVVNTRTAMYQEYDALKIAAADAFSEVVYGAGNTLTVSKGLWIEAVRATPSNNTTYTDFHIRACWDAPGTQLPMNLGTIVRLYEPAS